MASTPRTQRTVARAAHIAVGLLLSAIVYAPPYIGTILLPIAQFVAVPAVVITGLFLWQQGRVRSWFRKRETVATS